MEHRFEADAWVTLSPEEQICICRRLAEEALAVAAEQQSAERAEHYRKFAATWSQLAADIHAACGQPTTV